MNIRLTTPGSDEAIARGCLCPQLDNSHGKGYMGVEGRYVIHGECPLHALASR
jgi:hypothetical protein